MMVFHGWSPSVKFALYNICARSSRELCDPTCGKILFLGCGQNHRTTSLTSQTNAIKIFQSLIIIVSICSTTTLYGVNPLVSDRLSLDTTPVKLLFTFLTPYVCPTSSIRGLHWLQSLLANYIPLVVLSRRWWPGVFRHRDGPHKWPIVPVPFPSGTTPFASALSPYSAKKPQPPC